MSFFPPSDSKKPLFLENGLRFFCFIAFFQIQQFPLFIAFDLLQGGIDLFTQFTCRDALPEITQHFLNVIKLRNSLQMNK